MKKLLKVLFYVLLILAVIITSFIYSVLLGFAVLLLFFAATFYLNRATVFTAVAGFKFGRGETEEAIKWFKRAYDSGNAKPTMIISYAYVLLKSGEVDQSGNILDKVIASGIEKDDKLYARANRALVYWKKDRLDDAVAELEEVFWDYKTTTVYGSLGYLLILKGDMGKALAFNIEAYEYNSSNAVILDNLGQTYYLVGENEKAVEVYEELMKKNPTFPEAYFNYGLVLQKKEENEKALEYMKKALDYKFTYLSTVTREDIETWVNKLNQK